MNFLNAPFISTPIRSIVTLWRGNLIVYGFQDIVLYLNLKLATSAVSENLDIFICMFFLKVDFLIFYVLWIIFFKVVSVKTVYIIGSTYREILCILRDILVST